MTTKMTTMTKTMTTRMFLMSRTCSEQKVLLCRSLQQKPQARTHARLFSSSPSTRRTESNYATTSTASSQDLSQVCKLVAPNLRFGPGATAQVGKDLVARFNCRRVVVFTDRQLAVLPSFQTVVESLERAGVDYTVYDQTRVEPSNTSVLQAIDFLSGQDYDGVVAFGGGSVMDTAKAANLYACHPVQNFYDYVSPPLGKGLPIPGTVKPLIAIPTTAGTGSETTGAAIFDDIPTRCKTGIANRNLKPALGIIDPHNTASLPHAVAIYSGLDVLCRAVASYTALPFNSRGSNPISDIWRSLFALQTCAKWLVEVAKHPEDEHARAQMLLASAAAGTGFGNTGVHLCHGMSYPIASQVRSFPPASGYEGIDHALVPHGLSLIVNAPAVFRLTAEASNPDRHATCARLLAKARWEREGRISEPMVQETSWQGRGEEAGAWLADEILHLCRDLDVPMGLTHFGYDVTDIPALVEGTMQQHRATKISHPAVAQAELERLFANTMECPFK